MSSLKERFSNVVESFSHGEGTEPSTQAQPCIECGKRVHDVVVDALATGQQDGTIRKEIGDCSLRAQSVR